MEMFSWRDRNESKYKFNEAKVYKTVEGVK